MYVCMYVCVLYIYSLYIYIHFVIIRIGLSPLLSARIIRIPAFIFRAPLPRAYALGRGIYGRSSPTMIVPECLRITPGVRNVLVIHVLHGYI